jgi:quinoprotein dehydrogenase-associated probable ABC transporter substrate-binding protein
LSKDARRGSKRPVRGWLPALVLPLAVLWSQEARADELRVCADPNNLPFSDKAQAGFENKLAELVAQALGKTVSYTWRAQRRGFVRNTLKAKECDVVMGVPVGYDLVETTQPYYRSTYVFVSRRDRDLDISSLTDERLRHLSIGVHLIGDDGANTPPASALGEEGITANVRGFPIYGDYRQANPPARLIEAVENGEIDIAAAWGPLAGYVARSSPQPLRLAPIVDGERFAPLKFRFAIAMGVRHGDHALRQQLDEVIGQKRAEIRALLESFGTPVVDPPAAGGTN